MPPMNGNYTQTMDTFMPRKIIDNFNNNKESQTVIVVYGKACRNDRIYLLLLFQLMFSALWIQDSPS
jgi:hypothetical protein